MNGNAFYATTSLTIKSSSFIINSTIDIPFINGTFTRGSNDAFNKMKIINDNIKNDGLIKFNKQQIQLNVNNKTKIIDYNIYRKQEREL